jgi:hypothetical protein
LNATIRLIALSLAAYPIFEIVQPGAKIFHRKIKDIFGPVSSIPMMPGREERANL